MKVFLTAGEASGDINGANLVVELLKLIPDMQLIGTGGKKLKALGQVQSFTTEDMAIIGFDGVIKKLPFIFKMFKTLDAVVNDEKPDLIILVDYPGFNLRLAKKLRKYNIPIVYFIAPQFWVWDYKRIYILRDYCDLTLSIFPFERADLDKVGVNYRYVGNPMVDNIKFKFDSRREFLDAVGLSGDKPIIGILPGSRMKEVTSLMPAFIDATEYYKDRYDFVVSRAGSIAEGVIESYASKYNIPVLPDAQYDIMNEAEFLWVCSGTVALETAILKKPMVVGYSTSYLNQFLARLLTKLRTASLPNIMSGREVVPEVLKKKIVAKDIIAATKRAFADIDAIIAQLENISSQFEGMDSSKLAAEEIYSLLKDRKIIG